MVDSVAVPTTFAPPAVRNLLLAPLVAAVVAMAAAGCSSTEEATPGGGDAAATPSTTAAPGAAPASTACVAEEEVVGVIGANVTLDPGSGDEDGCHYYSADGAVSVGVVFEDPTTRTVEDVERNLEVDRVGGVGDAAYVSITPGGIVQFGVFVDDRHVLVTTQGVEPDPATAQAVYGLFA